MHINILFSCDLLDIIDSDQIHRPSKRSRYASQACRVSDGQQQLGTDTAIADITFPYIVEHGYCYRRHRGADYRIWKN